MPVNDIPERIGYLILLFLHKRLSDVQRKELDRWILQDEQHEILFDEVTGLGINLEDVSTSSTPQPNNEDEMLVKYRSKIRRQLFQ